MRGYHPGAQVFILSLAAYGILIHAEIGGDPGPALGPEQRNPLDALHHAVMLATPVPRHPLDLQRIVLFQSGVFHHQGTPWLGISCWASCPKSAVSAGWRLQQVGEGIVRRGLLCFGLTPGLIRARLAGR